MALKKPTLDHRATRHSPALLVISNSLLLPSSGFAERAWGAWEGCQLLRGSLGCFWECVCSECGRRDTRQWAGMRGMGLHSDCWSPRAQQFLTQCPVKPPDEMPALRLRDAVQELLSVYSLHSLRKAWDKGRTSIADCRTRCYGVIATTKTSVKL